MAAAVLEVGQLELSPTLHTLGKVLCCKVPWFTSTNPAASPKPLSLMKAGGPWWGTICKASNFYWDFTPVWVFSIMMVYYYLFTSITLELI